MEAVRDWRTVEMVRAACLRRGLRVLRVDLLGGCWAEAYQERGVLLERHPTGPKAARAAGSYPPPEEWEVFEVWAPEWAAVVADCTAQDPRQDPDLRRLLDRAAGPDPELRDALLAAEALGGMDAAHAIVGRVLGWLPEAA